MLKIEKNTGLVFKTPADYFFSTKTNHINELSWRMGEFIRLLNCPEYGAKIALSGIRYLSSYKYSKINSALADCHIFGTNPTPSSSGEHWKGCLPYKCASTAAWVNNLIPLSFHLSIMSTPQFHLERNIYRAGGENLQKDLEVNFWLLLPDNLRNLCRTQTPVERSLSLSDWAGWKKWSPIVYRERVQCGVLKRKKRIVSDNFLIMYGIKKRRIEVRWGEVRWGGEEVRWLRGTVQCYGEVIAANRRPPVSLSWNFPRSARAARFYVINW